MKLYNKQKQPVLDLSKAKELNRGGEGTIYQHPSNKDRVLKIYHVPGQSRITDDFMARLAQLSERFVKPLEFYYTSAGLLAGFEMRFVDKSKLVLLSLLFDKNIALAHGIDVTKAGIIVNHLADVMQEAHSVGLIIGDFNPYNVYVDPGTLELSVVDVDSLACDSKPHTGKLLSEIRNWKSMKIDESGDRFSQNVLAFWLLTSVHPYKGIHPKNLSLEERVITAQSVLEKNTGVIIPKCYRPLQDRDLENHFWAVFNHTLDQKAWVGKLPKTTIQVTPAIHMDTATLRIKQIPINGQVMWVLAVGKMVLVKSKTGMYSFSCPSSGLLLPDQEGTKLLINSTQSIGRANKGGDMYMIHSTMEHHRAYQKDNCLFVLFEATDMYQVYDLDQEHRGKFMSMGGEMFTRSVSGDYSPIQTIGGRTQLLDITPNGLRTIVIPDSVVNVYSRKDFHLLEKKTGNKIEYELMKRNGLSLKPVMALSHFAGFDQRNDNVVIPEDGYISVHRGLDGMVIAKLECPFVTQQSRLIYCDAGLLVLESGVLTLVNTK